MSFIITNYLKFFFLPFIFFDSVVVERSDVRQMSRKILLRTKKKMREDNSKRFTILMENYMFLSIRILDQKQKK